MSENATDDRDALTELLQSRGWQLYRELVMEEIAGSFEEHITKALDGTDSTLALDKMRQVAAVRKAGLRWLKLPKERLEMLSQPTAAPQMSRRGSL